MAVRVFSVEFRSAIAQAEPGATAQSRGPLQSVPEKPHARRAHPWPHSMTSNALSCRLIPICKRILTSAT